MNSNPNALDFIYQDINDLREEIRSIRSIIEERLPHPETAIISIWDIIKKIEVLEIEINTLKTLLNNNNLLED